MIEEEAALFLDYLEAKGRRVAPDLVRLFVEALNRFQRERRARSELLANMGALPEGAFEALFDDYHLFLASQDLRLLKKAEKRRKP